MKVFPDINVLIALFDTSHQHHLVAKREFMKYVPAGWCSCSMSQNGFIRIVSNPSYLNSMSVAEATTLLKLAVERTNHTYLDNTLSLLDTHRFETTKLLTHKQISDLFLIGMAIHYDVKLLTFDRNIPTHAAIGFNDRHLLVI